MTAPREPDDQDLLAAYVDGDPDAVRAAAPVEPTEAEWDAARRCICGRLGPPPRPASRRWVSSALAGIGSVAAAAVAWAVLVPPAPPPPPADRPAPEVVDAAPVPNVPVASLPHESADPLAEFAVLPVAHEDEVVLSRVPGDGWLPVGADPLPDTLPLATAADVRVEDTEATWPKVAPAPGYAPMIFAIKPR